MRRLSAGIVVLGGLCLATLNAGCQREGQSPDSQPLHFPLNAGWVWQYQVDSSIAGKKVRERYTVRNQGRTHWVDGADALVRTDSRGNQYLLRQTSDGIRRLASRDEVATKWRPDPNQPVRFVLREPLRAGTYWQVESVSYLVRANADMPRQPPGGQRLLMGFEIIETDASIQVPAGTFSNCLLVVGKANFRVYADGIKGFRTVPVLQREWYCPNVGLVKLERTETVSTPQYGGGTSTFQLLSLTR